MVDLISDTLTRIRNAQRVMLSYVDCISSNMCVSMLEVFKKEGYIEDYGFVSESDRKKDMKLRVNLKYKDGLPVISSIERVSKPGLRVYKKISELPLHMNGLGIYIVSTSSGVVSDREARKLNVGGEIICKVF